MLLLAIIVSCKIEGPTEEKNETGDIGLITHPDGLLTNFYADCRNGCFHIYQYSDDFHRNIVYLDYETATQVFLSADATIPEDSPENTSYIPNAYSGMYLACDKDGLYLFKSSNDLLIKKYGEKALGCISSLSFNGDDRKIIKQFKANEWFRDTSAVAADDKYLYYIVYELDEANDDRIVSCKLIQKGKHSDKENTILTLDGEDRHFIIGRTGNTLIMKTISAPEKDDPIYLQLTNQNHKVYAVNVYSKEEELLTEYKQGEGDRLFYLDNLYIIDKKEKMVYRKARLDDSYEPIIDFSVIYAESGQILDVYFIQRVFDNHLMIAVVEGETTSIYAYDIQSNTINQITPYIGDYFCGIYGESEKQFLVAKGEKLFCYDTVIYGKKEKQTAEVLDFVLIDKTDYWNSEMNLIDVVDYVYVE
jgi:hypothetical protein